MTGLHSRLFLCATLAAAPRLVLAWQSTGHRVVTETACYLLSPAGKREFLRRECFALAYYATVPDLVWKRDRALLPREVPEHFVDLDRLRRELPKMRWLPHPEAFFAAYPAAKRSWGGVLWRIAELDQNLSRLAGQLAGELDPERRRELQDLWLLRAGLLSHYVADLAVPLHVTENDDGQLSGQKGLHSHFEATILNHLMPELGGEVWRHARDQWPAFSGQKRGSAFDIALALAEDSAQQLPELLSRDKTLGRQPVQKVANALGPLVRQRLVVASLTLALLWQRRLGWRHDDTPHVLVPSPAFVVPGLEP